LLYLGRLEAKKGIENLLAACAALKQTSRLAFSLTVAGSGAAGYERSLHERIERLALTDHVIMAGAVHGARKEQLLNAAGVVVVPSFTENFAIVVAEALAHGVPVITSKGTPWARVAEIGCGLWIDNDPASLASAIVQIAAMPLAEMGRRGRRWMAAEFAWDERAKSMLRVYRRCLGLEGAVAAPLADHA
jgi:glycosyltransferase involved in cell wall biosynthesis